MKDSIKEALPLVIDLIEENWEYCISKLVDSGHSSENALTLLTKTVDDLYEELNR